MTQTPLFDENVPKVPTNPELADLQKVTTKEIAKVIQAEIQKNMQQVKKQEDYEQLQRIMTEYLQCFLVIGYTFDNQPIVIGQSNNAYEYNALVEHLRKTFIRIMNKTAED